MDQRPNAHIELGRVVNVNARHYTVNVLTRDGRTLFDVPFLSAYAIPASNGQGVYSMPEVGSYVMVMRTVSLNPRNRYGVEVFCWGFFTPMDEHNSFVGGREDMDPGDSIMKTPAGNKVKITTDGVVWIYAADLAQIQLFPASGNVNDSAGLDHLLRMLFENLEFRTLGGQWEWRANKKEGTVNYRQEFRNRILIGDNPDVWVENLGSQGPLGDGTQFRVLERYQTESGLLVLRGRERHQTDGRLHAEWFDEDESLVVSKIQEPTGERSYAVRDPEHDVTRVSWHEDEEGTLERVTRDENNDITHRLTLRSDGTMDEEHFESGEVVWSSTRASDGSTVRRHYTGGGVTFEESIAASGATTLKIPGDGSKTLLEVTPAGKVTLETDDAVEVTSKTNQIILKALTKVILEAPEVELADGPMLGKVLTHLAAAVYNGHVHTAPAGGGATSGPSATMSEGAHWSTKTSTG